MNKVFQNKPSNVTERLKSYEVSYARIVCFAAALLYIIVGFFLELIDDSAIEYASHRILIATFFISIYIGSFKSNVIRKHAKLLTFIVLWLAIYWSIWISHINEFSFNYSLILITAIAATASIFLNRTLVIIFLTTTTISLLAIVYLTKISGFNPLTLAMCTAILVTIYSIKEYHREQIVGEVKNLNDALSLNNVGLEDKVKKRTSLLEQKNKELEQFTYVVSHDLKSPLRNIGSFSSLISKKIEQKDYDSLNSYTEVINMAVSNMSSLINDLLQYGKIGQTEDKLVKTNFVNLVEEIKATNFSSEVFQNVNFTIADNFPNSILCYEKQIALVFQNLIGNSIKYNQSKSKEINIYYNSTSTHHQIFIEDNGIGINKKYRDQVFVMFSRLHSANSYEGTGIGLTICQKIIFMHQGKIDFFSEEGKGTTFWFEISKSLN